MAENFTPEEQYKFDVITKVLKKEIKPGMASKLLSISSRQVRRLKNKVKSDGINAVAHKLKGKCSNHRINPSIKEKAINVLRQTYSDFKPTFATEKLEECHSIRISPETTRLWMTKEGLWKTRKQKKTGEYRSWRPRKEYFGEMEQFDGSYHFWFENRYLDQEGRPIEVCLLASIDDAAGKITKAKFTENEGVIAVFNFWRDYVLSIGKPLSVYLDKFSTYKINHKNAVDNHEFMTQFQRAMLDLGTNLISAHSAEAKGRVERLFGTLQDRLIKEMRLAGVNNPKDGNIFLKEIFIPKFNNKFAIAAAKEENVHKALSEVDKKNLNRIFSVQSKRRVNNDFTIQFKNRYYQLEELQPTTVRARDTIIVEEWLNGAIHFFLRGKYLNFTVLPEKPSKNKQLPLILTTHKLNWKPPQNHPWRQYRKPKH